MEVIHVDADRREEWNGFVLREPSFAILQSWEWGEFKEKLGWKVIRTALEQQGRIVAGAQILIKPAPLGLFSIAYVPRGPVGKWLDEEIAPYLLDELHQVARCKRAIFLKIEPPLLYDPKIHRKLERYGNQRQRRPGSPRHLPECRIRLERISSNLSESQRA